MVLTRMGDGDPSGMAIVHSQASGMGGVRSLKIKQVCNRLSVCDIIYIKKSSIHPSCLI